MRVHDTRTGQFCYRKPDDPPYAILSHTWDASEQLFQDVQRIQHSVDILTLLRMIYPALLWCLATSASYLLHLLTHALGTHNSLPPTRNSDSLLATRHERVFHVRIHIAYALHGWSQSLETTARNILPQLSVLNDLRLSEKLRNACAVARGNHFRQLWVDTSCIDKSSSSELSEAINSMFAWYRDTAVCFAYLSDVPRSSDHRRPGSPFRHSRWFTRGWTLQELVAPRVVVFLSWEWVEIGTKENLADLIEEITGIDRDVLMHRKPLEQVSVAARMSWAAERASTRVEDQAYCLLGIFDIFMTPIYGEGINSFKRLQEAILRRIPDDSIFAWESHVYDMPEMSGPQLASSSSYSANPRNHLMRLLDTAMGQFVDRHEGSETPYAVLSHTWEGHTEVKYDDILAIQRNTRLPLGRAALRWPLSILLFLLRTLASAGDRTRISLVFWLRDRVDRFDEWTQRRLLISIIDNPGLSPKIRNTCTIANRDGHALVWIHSACIDHGNRTEVRQTVTSVYSWFRDATMCYVYLPGVPFAEDPRAEHSSFRSSEWFKRCWTLQELVAPREVIFLSEEWRVIGTKESLADLLKEITGVHRKVLRHEKLVEEVSVAKRISWVANRTSRRVEDRAYCLFGILDITMTPRYGEGQWAFRRLREKILRRNSTETLISSKTRPVDYLPEAWRTLKAITAEFTGGKLEGSSSLTSSLKLLSPPHTLLAPSPRAFLFGGSIHSISLNSDFRKLLNTPNHPFHILRREYNPSPYGIRTEFHLIPLTESTGAEGMEASIKPRAWYLAILACEDSSFPESKQHLLACLCYASSESGSSSMTLHVGECSREGGSDFGALTDDGLQQPSLICLPSPQDSTSTPVAIPISLNPPIVKSVYIPYIQYSSHFGQKIDWFGTKPPDVTKIMVKPWVKAALHSRGYHIEYTGSNTPDAPKMISLHCFSIPLILCLKKDRHEAAIFLPIRKHRYNGYDYGWIVNDDDGSMKTLSCGVVTSADSIFKTLTGTSHSGVALPGSLEDVKHRCASKTEWRIGSEILRPSLDYIAVGNYDLRINIVQA